MIGHHTQADRAVRLILTVPSSGLRVWLANPADAHEATGRRGLPVAPDARGVSGLQAARVGGVMPRPLPHAWRATQLA